jgi:hypothetical protein
MTNARSHFQYERQDPITPLEAYDPTYWQNRATQARRNACGAPASLTAAFNREASDYERLAAYAAALLAASKAA